jgi:lipooligosaccharide transport system permease protein
MATEAITRRLSGEALSLARALALAERNATLLRSAGAYALLIVAGFAEPVLYLLSLGWGVGRLVGEVHTGGQTVPYLTFLAPALVGSSAMTGALGETTVNFFAKLKYFRHYTPILNTPVNPGEIALGELAWSVIRGGLYGAIFLLGIVVIGVARPLLALAAFPVGLLISGCFGGLGLATSSYMRGWPDFEYVGGATFALFVFSGTFVPVSTYPGALQVIVRLTPLYHGVLLMRGIMLGQLGWSLLASAAYLVVLGTVAMVIATRRLRRLFRD